MEQDSKKKIICQKNVNKDIFQISNSNLDIIESIPTNTKENFNKKREINTITDDKKIVLYEVPIKEENNIITSSYKEVIKRIANKFKKRVKLPKCKIFKCYIKYRLLVLRIANGVKKGLKKCNFSEKLKKNKTKQDINQIQKINNSNELKIIKEGRKNKEIIFLSERKKNIKIKLSLFTKNENNEKSDLNINNNNEIDNQIDYLTSLKIEDNDINKFIDEFSSFLEKNDILICSETKLPIFKNTNNKYLLNLKQFWKKYILFISNKYKGSLTIYNFIYFIEQYYIWNNDKKSDDFNREIKKQINNLFNEEIINNFLITYKIENLDQIFERYKFINRNTICYKEIKISNSDCNCPTCKNNGFIDKVINFNKKNNKVSLSENNNISFLVNKTNENNNSNKNEDKSLNNNKDENEDFLNNIKKGHKERKNCDK